MLRAPFTKCSRSDSKINPDELILRETWNGVAGDDFA